MNTGSPSLDAQSEYTALADFRLAPSSSPAKGPQVSHVVIGEAERCAVYFNQIRQEQKTLDRTNQCNRNVQKRAQDQRDYGTFPFIQNVLNGIKKNVLIILVETINHCLL